MHNIRISQEQESGLEHRCFFDTRSDGPEFPCPARRQRSTLNDRQQRTFSGFLCCIACNLHRAIAAEIIDQKYVYRKIVLWRTTSKPKSGLRECLPIRSECIGLFSTAAQEPGVLRAECVNAESRARLPLWR